MRAALQLDSLNPTDVMLLTEQELEALARNGRVGPAIGRGLGNELVQRVSCGVKPATLMVSAAAAGYALELGLVVRAVSTAVDNAVVDFHPWPDAPGPLAPDEPANSEVVYAVAATTEAMDRLEAAYHASQAGAEAGLRGHAELGLALGYTPADVAAYLLRARTLARSEDPRT
jgi:hypothetical protein